MNIELTNYATPGDNLVPKVVDLVKKHGLQNRMLFSSFFARNLQNDTFAPARSAAWIALHARQVRVRGDGHLAWRGDYFALHPYLTDVTPGLVNRVQAAGKRVHVWTVNPEEELKRMIGLGVDGIITDDPVLALRLLGRSK